MLRLVVFCALVAVAFAQSPYCNVCSNHTLCLYNGPSSECRDLKSESLTADEKKAALDAHNTYRNKVAMGEETRPVNGEPQPSASNMLKMVWDDELTTIAEMWAKQCTFKHDACRKRQNGDAVGQNIYWEASSGPLDPPNWADAVQDWYNEVDLHDGRRNTQPFAAYPKVGHYTQVVWAASNKLGCGHADYIENIEGEDWYSRIYVCNYGPAGNFLKSRIYSVGSPASQCPKGTKADSQYPGLCA